LVLLLLCQGVAALPAAGSSGLLLRIMQACYWFCCFFAKVPVLLLLLYK